MILKIKTYQTLMKMKKWRNFNPKNKEKQKINQKFHSLWKIYVLGMK
jgi:hypothetical protein